MSPLPRVRRAPWADARFAIGIVLVLVSIAGVWLIVSSGRRTTPVLQADRQIVVGESLTPADFVVAEVGLGAAIDDYLAPQQLTPGLVATRSIAPGELLPAAATGPADQSRTTTLVVRSSAGLPGDVAAGTLVELWQAPPTDDGYDEPRVLVSAVTVADVIEDDRMLAQDGPAVELVVDRADVADVLSAITAGAALSIVPLGLP